MRLCSKSMYASTKYTA
uniref:Uncharacterized protein n=1 Tax=Arundo donax TaxID=35708 RepID=A0A0A9FIC9_ARUDO